jgi:hypothetical protein
MIKHASQTSPAPDSYTSHRDAPYHSCADLTTLSIHMFKSGYCCNRSAETVGIGLCISECVFLYFTR